MSDQFRRITKVEFNEPAAAAAAAVAPAAGSSSSTAPATIPTVVNAGLAAVDKKAILAGGFSLHANNGEGGSVNQVLEYDMATRSWTNFTPTVGLPTSRSEGVLFAIGNTYYLFGGYDDEGCVSDMLKLEVSNPQEGLKAQTKGWEPVGKSTDGPSPRRGHSIAVLTKEEVVESGTAVVGSAYLFGGFDGSNRLNDLWEFNSTTQQWSLLQTSVPAPTPRDDAALTIDKNENRLWLFGGYSSSRKNDLYYCDLGSGSWTQVPNEVSPTPRCGCFGAFNLGVAVFGLGQEAKGPSAGVFQLSTEHKWILPTIEGGDELEPLTQFSWTVVDGGKKVFIYGGFNEKKFSTAMYELELERGEPLAATKGKK